MAKIVKKGKRKVKPKKPSERWKKYKIENGNVVRQRNCPRCGLGIFLARHKDRLFCGKCSYTEFLNDKK